MSNAFYGFSGFAKEVTPCINIAPSLDVVPLFFKCILARLRSHGELGGELLRGFSQF